MPDIKIKKDGQDYPLQTMPLHYPADRVYLDGDVTKTVQDEIVPKSTGGTFGGGITINTANGTSSVTGKSILTAGNSTASGTVGNARGVVRLYSRSQYYADLETNVSLTENINIGLPDKSGTLALERGSYSREYTNQKWIDILSNFWNSRIDKTKLTLFSRLHVHTSSYDKFFTLCNSNCMEMPSPSYASFVVPVPGSGRNEEIYFDNTATLNWYKRYVYNGTVDTDYSQDTVSTTLTMYY